MPVIRPKQPIAFPSDNSSRSGSSRSSESRTAGSIRGSTGSRDNRNKRRRKTNTRIREIFILVFIALVVLSIIAVIVWKCLPKHSVTAQSGHITFDYNTNGVIIRDEACYSAEENFDRILFHAKDGATISKNAPVARIFRWGYTDDIMQSLFEVQSQIQSAQYKLLTGISTPEVNSVNNQIDAIVSDIREVVSNKNTYADLLDLEVQLKTALVNRDTILRDKTQPTEELQALYTTETRKKDTLADWASEIVSADSGLVSYYFDGFEPSLNLANAKIDKYISSTLISKVLANTTFTTAANSTSNVYRIIKDNKWCYAFITSVDSPTRLVEGQHYNVAFSGYETKQFTGTATSVDISGSKIVNILEFSQPLGDFINIRSISATVRQEFNGVQVLVSALSYDDGIPYITVMRDENETKLKVNVLAADKRYAIVQALDGEIFVDGQQYLVLKKVKNKNG